MIHICIKIHKVADNQILLKFTGNFSKIFRKTKKLCEHAIISFKKLWALVCCCDSRHSSGWTFHKDAEIFFHSATRALERSATDVECRRSASSQRCWTGLVFGHLCVSVEFKPNFFWMKKVVWTEHQTCSTRIQKRFTESVAALQGV